MSVAIVNRLTKITKINELATACLISNAKRTYKYQTTMDSQMRYQQNKFPKLTSQVFIQREEVANYDGFKLVEPLVDKTKEPHKLHLIKKIKSFTGEPWWIKHAMKKLGFPVRREWTKTYSIKPNTPEINNLLWLCKHVVKILPVNMDANGEPTVNDVSYTKLNLQTGKLEIIQELKTLDTINGVPVTCDVDSTSTTTLDRKELQRYMNSRREQNLLNDEYFPTVYEWKYDQDKAGVRRNLNGLAHTSISQDE